MTTNTLGFGRKILRLLLEALGWRCFHYLCGMKNWHPIENFGEWIVHNSQFWKFQVQRG